MPKENVIDSVASTEKPSTLLDYGSALNPQQYQAVTAKPGPLLVIAGAGSGKTRTLTYRVAYLIENGIEPYHILLLTFTNKASREMLDRVARLLPQDISQIWGGTFHSIGHRLLRRHAELLGYQPDFTILDADDSAALAANALQEVGLDPKDRSAPKGDLALHLFGLALNRQIPLSEVIEKQYPDFEDKTDSLEKAQKYYQKHKKESNVVDYDDLIVLTLRLLHEFPEIREKYQHQFQHILVDEYQDTTSLQSALIDVLAKEHQQVMVVGDDAQSIYSWRGAHFRNILSFPDRYPKARVIPIEKNYRSSPEILSVANHAIRCNTLQFEKNLSSTRPLGQCPKPNLVGLENTKQQAHFIMRRIHELQKEGISPNEIAILYRSHFHSLEIQMELTRQEIPFEVTSGLRFFEQAHIKDVSAYLRLALNPQDEMAFHRLALMLPGIGKKSTARLWKKVSTGESMKKIRPPAASQEGWDQLTTVIDSLRTPALLNEPSAQIRKVLEATYRDTLKTKYTNATSRLEDLYQLSSFAQTFHQTDEFLAQLALLTNVDQTGGSTGTASHSMQDPSQQVRLSSIHQSKGLEWKVVFLIMLCEGLFPSSRSLEDQEAEEEERRLFYVAVTRAKDELYFTYPFYRMAAGQGYYRQKPSRFLKGLPTELLHSWKTTSSYESF